MARDFEDFKNQYLSYIKEMDQKRESVLGNYQEQLRDYEERLQKYRDATSGFFTRWLGEVIPMPQAPQVPDLSSYAKLPNITMAEVGQRFAIRYGDITTSISGVRTTTSDSFPPAGYNMVSSTRRTRVDEAGLDTHNILGDIADLWTVVEYLGNGQYQDLVTGEILVTPTKSNDVLDTVTQSTEQEARKQQENLQQYPLGIKAMEITRVKQELDSQAFELSLTEVPITDEIFPALEALTPEIQEEILQTTIPRKEEILSKLTELRQVAIARLSQYFEKANELIIDRYYNDAMNRSEQAQIEEEQIRQAVRNKLEEIKAQQLQAKEQEEKRRQKESELARQREVETEFETMFAESEQEPVLSTLTQK